MTFLAVIFIILQIVKIILWVEDVKHDWVNFNTENWLFFSIEILTSCYIIISCAIFIMK